MIVKIKFVLLPAVIDSAKPRRFKKNFNLRVSAID